MSKKTFLIISSTIWSFIFFSGSIKAQEVFAPDGYSLSATFPDSYSVVNKTTDESQSVYLPNLYEATYKNPNNQLLLSATFGTFQKTTKPTNKEERKSHLEGLANEIKQQTNTEFYLYEPFDVGVYGSGISFTCSKGKKRTPVYNGIVLIVDDKLYMFFAKLSDLKYQNQVHSFFKSAIGD